MDGPHPFQARGQDRAVRCKQSPCNKVRSAKHSDSQVMPSMNTERAWPSKSLTTEDET